MAPSTNLTDEEMVAKAQGVDVLSPDEVRCKSTKAHSVTSWRIKSFFNTREGWFLRRVAHGHSVIRRQRTNCVLYGHNVKGALRPAATGKCSLCHAALCTIPREGETGLSCFQEWHQRYKLKPHIYRTQPHNTQSNLDNLRMKAHKAQILAQSSRICDSNAKKRHKKPQRVHEKRRGRNGSSGGGQVTAESFAAPCATCR